MALTCGLAGCSAGAEVATGDVSDAGLKAAQALVAEATVLSATDLPLPSEPVARQKLRVFVVSPNASNPYSTLMVQSFQEAAGVMGWELSPAYDAASSATKGAGFIRQAVQEGYNAIYYPSMQVDALRGPVQEALAAGLTIACPDCAPQQLGDSFITPTTDNAEIGRRLAAHAITTLQGKGTILTYPDPEYSTITQRFEAFDEYIAQNCPACTVKPTQFTAASLAQPGPPVWASALSTNPPGTVDLAVAPFAVASRLFATTQQSRGRSDIKIMDTGNSDVQQLDLLATKSLPYIGSTAVPEQYEAWASVDLIARVRAGQPLYDVTKLPSVLATPDNAVQFKSGSAEPDIDYKTRFTELWR
ncbi:hypothetical protein GCM10010472_65790 [Pseudonocardia halophobica]|uniref:Periplasmic binding protein domain-containing protein n=1 Tax=Pseudonocardia halophobica TaxID=29401 RepID=A0A9W6L8U6_9PSEU|nr:substrate-binding domain-containing protein [Pseudonocardia halophobica]GLL14030.1 hypothetical protein GCM10017577_51750 [Pseudonocardia halophobica]